MIAGFDGVGLRHISALFGFSVKTCAGLVIDARIGVDPDHDALFGGDVGCLAAGLRQERWLRAGGWLLRASLRQCWPPASRAEADESAAEPSAWGSSSLDFVAGLESV